MCVWCGKNEGWHPEFTLTGGTKSLWWGKACKACGRVLLVEKVR